MTSKTKEAFYAGWRAARDAKDEFVTEDSAWERFEQRMATRPSFQVVCERLVVLLSLLAILAFIVAPLLIKFEKVVQ